MTILSSYTSCSDNYAKGTNTNMRLLWLNNPVHHINLIHPVQTKEISEIINELNEVFAA